MSLIKGLFGSVLTFACGFTGYIIGKFSWKILTTELSRTTGLNLLLAIIGIPVCALLALCTIGAIIFVIIGDI